MAIFLGKGSLVTRRHTKLFQRTEIINAT